MNKYIEILKISVDHEFFTDRKCDVLKLYPNQNESNLWTSLNLHFKKINENSWSVIHVAPGQEKHLAYEVWHVAQQKQGRVQPTTEVGGMPVNDNASLENEADVMGSKAAVLKRNI